ncbi:MAG: hypothetical protein ACOC9W_04135 [Persicimonas sp.]
MKRFWLIWMVGLLGAACTEENPYNTEPLVADACEQQAREFEGPAALDILVVVDNSGDVMREQQRLAMAMPDFLGTLEARGLSTRVGVVSTDASAEADLREPGTIYEGCEQNSGQIADSDGAGDWKRIAACNVMIGDDGQERQQALKVIERSIVDRPGQLDGFFRDQARLLVVVLTNEDDCSGDEALPGEDPTRSECVWHRDRLTEVDAVVESIHEQTESRRDIALAVFAGPPSGRDVEQGEQVRPVCQGTLGAAYPSNRLYEATRALGQHGHFDSLCTDDLSFGLAEVAAEVEQLYCADELNEER